MIVGFTKNDKSGRFLEGIGIIYWPYEGRL